MRLLCGGLGRGTPRTVALQWRTYGNNVLDLVSGRFDTGVAVQSGVCLMDRLDYVNLFYVCASCGKVYWEGSHHRRIKQQMKLLKLVSEPADRDPAIVAPLVDS